MLLTGVIHEKLKKSRYFAHLRVSQKTFAGHIWILFINFRSWIILREPEHARLSCIYDMTEGGELFDVNGNFSGVA